MWPDCVLSKYLVVNERLPALAGVTPLAVGPDAGWSANLRKALSRVPHAYVFLFIDDLLLTERVHNRDVEELMLWAMAQRARYVRFRPLIRRREHGALPVALDGETPYRASTVMSFWRKDVLFDMLVDGENAWQFEIRGTERARVLDGFFATERDYFPHYNLVVKRKFRRRAVRILSQSGYEIDLRHRELMSRRADAAETLRELRAAVVKRMPRKVQIVLRRLLMPESRYDGVDRRRTG
jgi:hypothetical protein